MKENNSISKDLYNKRKSNNLCTDCGEPLPNKSTRIHLDCKIRRNKLRQENRVSRKKLGLCCECDQPKYRGVYCLNHHILHRKYFNNRKERMTEKGLCHRCNALFVEGTEICEICLLKGFSLRLWKTRKNWQILKNLYDHQNGKCVYSKEPIFIGVNASIDHKIPKSKGGSDDISNLQWVTYKVNVMKWDSTEEEFFEQIKLLAAHI